jgi:predicted DNA-binding transcriptional regulator AlpA
MSDIEFIFGQAGSGKSFSHAGIAIAAGLLPLLSTKEASAILGVSIGTLAKWRVEGSGPKFIKSNRIVGYDQKDIADWISSRRVSSTIEGASAINTNKEQN